MLNIIIITVITLVGIFLLLCLMIYLYLRPKVYISNRQKRSIDEYTAGELVPEKISFHTSDNISSVGLFYSAGHAKAPVVILLHGYAYHMGAYHKRTIRLVKEGWHVFSFDFRGCGESTFQRTTIGLNEPRDLAGAVEYLKSRDDIDKNKIVLWGGSMGAAAALRSLPLLDNIQVVISDSSFYDIFSVFRNHLRKKHLPYTLLPLVILVLSFLSGGNQWLNNVAESIRKISTVPILFIHGDKDIDISYEDSVKLHELYSGPKSFYKLDGHGHHNHDDIPGYIDIAVDFIREHLNSH